MSTNINWGGVGGRGLIGRFRLLIMPDFDAMLPYLQPEGGVAVALTEVYTDKQPNTIYKHTTLPEKHGRVVLVPSAKKRKFFSIEKRDVLK